VPGPFTMTQQARDDHYGDPRSLALGYAEAVNEELRDLKAAGSDIVQIDEPYLQARPEAAREDGREGVARALEGGGPPLRAVCRSRPRARAWSRSFSGPSLTSRSCWEFSTSARARSSRPRS